jgi:uncharacterized protein YndB with AHSA1/START domain
MMSDQNSKPELVMTRRFDAPIARVWDAWVEPAQFAQWLGPQGSTTHLIEADIRTGGKLRTRMETEHGTLLTAFFYREVTKPNRIVWEHCFADETGQLVRPHFFDVWPLKLLSTVALEEAGAGTLVTLHWEPIEASPEEVHAFVAAMAGMDAGWVGSFDQLEAFLAG